MAKTELKINWDYSSKNKTYDLKKYNGVNITYFATSLENLHDNLDHQVTFSGSTLKIKVSGGSTYTFKNVSSNLPFRVHTQEGIDSFNSTISVFCQEFIDFQYIPNKKRVISGTMFGDEIDLTNETKYPLKNGIGYSVSSGAGDDTIIGTKGNDTITGGNGNDYINGNGGNDTITGGSGQNTIRYSYWKGGNYTVNLTKGEKLNIDTDINKASIKYEISGKNAKIILPASGTEVPSSIILKNFAAKDVTNNYKKGKADTSYVKLTDNMNQEQDLRKDTIWSNKITKNYSGSYLNENIDASGAAVQKKKGKIVNLSINGGAGNDTIVGSKYNDTINGGAGADYLTGGKGNDTLTGGKSWDCFIFHKNDGVDTIIDAVAEDWITICDDEILANHGSDLRFVKNGNNLEIYYSADLDPKNKIIVKNHFKNKAANRLESLIISNTANDTYDTHFIDLGSVPLIIKGTNKADTLTGFASDDTIYGYAGNDKITGGKGSDTINAGKGNNNIVFNLGDGDDIIKYGGGKDTLVFAAGTAVTTAYDGDDLKVTYSGTKNNIEYSNTITIKDYADSSKRSVKYIQIGETKYLFIARGETVKNLSVTTKSSIKVMLAGGFGQEGSIYTIKSLSKTRKFSLNYLENGRLLINGSYIDVRANEGQKDDIIIWGSRNKIYTGDKSDIVRIGGAMDSGADSNYVKQGNYNTVNTGAGDDYIIYYGAGNIINGGEGSDYALSLASKSLSTNIQAETVRDYMENETDDSVDGTISSFNQGHYGGDCRLLSVLQSIKDDTFSDYVNIEKDENNYTVTFNNYNVTGKEKSVTFSKNNLEGFANVYGDMDVVLTDYALNELLKINGDSATSDRLSNVETASYNMLAKYIFGTDKITVGLSDSYDQEQVGVSYDYATRLSEMWNLYQNGTLSNLTIGIDDGEDDYSLGIIVNHAYAVKNLDDTYISLVNVWDSNDILNLDLNRFYDINTNAFSYGTDYYNEHIIMENYEGTAANLPQLSYETAGWISSGSDYAPLPNGIEPNTAAELTAYFINENNISMQS